jgi:hypothetical protein
MSYSEFLWQFIKPGSPAFLCLGIGITGLVVMLLKPLLTAGKKGWYAELADAVGMVGSVASLAGVALSALVAVLAVFGIGK